MPKIQLTGHIDVPADRLAEVGIALETHISLTRAEAGCIRFEVTPCDTLAGRYLFSELFMDRTAFDAHQARAKAADWGKITQGIPRRYEIVEID